MEKIKNNNDEIEKRYICETIKLPEEIFNRLVKESRLTGINKEALICLSVCHFLAMQDS